MRVLAPAFVALSVSIALAACGDIFHATNWSSRCEDDPGACSVAGGAGGSGGGGGADGGMGGQSGGAGAGAGAGGALAFEDVCQAYAAGYCPRLAECRPLLYEIVGGVAMCETMIAASCNGFWSGATDFTMTPDDLSACVDAIGFASASCGRITRISAGQILVPECRVAGVRSNDAACIDPHQCQGLGCRPGVDTPCGSCFTIGKAGEACSGDVECEPGLHCVTNVCTAWLDETAPCTTSAECYADLFCNGTSCVPRSPLGAGCNVMNPGCAVDLYCGGVEPTCLAWAFAPQGAECGSLPTQLTGCQYGSFCQIAMAGDSVGVCSPQGQPGQACPTAPSIFAGPCRYPSGCYAMECQLATAFDCN